MESYCGMSQVTEPSGQKTNKCRKFKSASHHTYVFPSEKTNRYPNSEFVPWLTTKCRLAKLSGILWSRSIVPTTVLLACLLAYLHLASDFLIIFLDYMYPLES